MIIVDLFDNEIKGEALQQALADLDEKMGEQPGHFERVVENCATCEAARWELMACSDLSLFATEKESCQ